MQKSRTDRVRGPEGQGVRSPAAGERCGTRGVRREFTTGAAFEVLPRTTARQPLRRPPSPAARDGTMARDVEALDLPAWSRVSGPSQGPQCRSVP